jgi:hypothetical protein
VTCVVTASRRWEPCSAHSSWRAKWTRWRLVAYAVVMGLAIAAQLFAVVVLLMHVAWIATRRSWPQAGRLAPAWISAAAIGVAANANIQAMELLQHGYPPSVFYPTFPRDVVFFLVGAPVLLPLGLWLSTVGRRVDAARRAMALGGERGRGVGRRHPVAGPAARLPVSPLLHLPRAGVRLPDGGGHRSWKVLAPVVVAGAVVAAIVQIPGYTEDPLALPPAAAAAERIHSSGGRVCVIHSDEQVLAAYTRDFAVVSSPDQLAECDAVLVVSWNVDLALRDLAAQEFSRATSLNASYPAVVLER